MLSKLEEIGFEKDEIVLLKREIIKKLKEEEYQDGFFRDVFVDVLGYTLKPDGNFNLVREFKNHWQHRQRN